MEGKVVPVPSTKSYRRRKGVPLLILILGARWWVINIDTPAASPSAQTLCTHCTGGCTVPSADLHNLEIRKSLFFPVGIRNPDRPAHSLVDIPTFVDMTKKPFRRWDPNIIFGRPTSSAVAIGTFGRMEPNGWGMRLSQISWWAVLDLKPYKLVYRYLAFPKLLLPLATAC
jgi:hypothetical protein